MAEVNPLGTTVDPNNLPVTGQDTGLVVIIGGTSQTSSVIDRSDLQYPIKLGHLHMSGNLNVDGDHNVSGTLNVVQDIVLAAQASDCAEDFDIGTTHGAEPSTVMVLDESGALRPSEHDYDRKVAGVISGAGEYRPGMVLGRGGSSGQRAPIALIGKVYCKADAKYAPIGVGDLLTTSPTQGHAMKASDPVRAFGAVIGKALRPLQCGQGLVPVLIALQ